MRRKILLAEDEEHIARLISFKLQRENLEVVHAADGESAVQAFEAGSGWSLVILDVMMPRQDGWGALQRIRATESGRSVPILMLTAKAEAQVAAQAAELGATEFLRKPFDPDELTRVALRLSSARKTPDWERDPEIAALKREFVESFPSRVAALSTALNGPGGVQAGDLERLAHKLAGAALTYGFEEIGAAADRVEELSAGAADADALGRAARRLIELLEKTSAKA